MSRTSERELRQDQVTQRDEAQQLAVFVRHVDVVDRFLLGGLLTQPVDRFFDGDIGQERRVVRGHHRPGAALRVREQLADVFAVRLGHQRQQALDGMRVELLQERRRGRRATSRRAAPTSVPGRLLRPARAASLPEGTRRCRPAARHRRGSKQGPDLFDLQPFDELRDTGRVQIVDEGRHALRVPFGQHHADFGEQQGIHHGGTLRSGWRISPS